MAKEIIVVDITGVSNSDEKNVMVNGIMPNGERFGITTLVPECQLRYGDKANAIVDKDTEGLAFPNGTPIGPVVKGIWGNACQGCIHNPYIIHNQKQCAAAKHD